jgi:hypothetical protein
MSFTRCNYVLQEAKNYREISATSYNKLGHIIRGLLPDNKTEKEILI